MRAYYYTPQECGMSEFPSGLLQLSGFESTNNPDDADVFVVPPIMMFVGRDNLLNLPYLKGNETRHVMFNVADWIDIGLGIPAIMFRCDTTQHLLEIDPTVVAWPWPVEDLGDWMDRSFEYDVVFQGWVSTPLTDVVCDSVVNTKGLNSYIKRHNFFYGYQDESKPETQELRRTFLETLAASRLSLVPRSIPAGIVRYRFYEAMSMGRIPVHFCDRCVLPFVDRIDYDVCSIHIQESESAHAGEIIADWLAKHDDDEIRERGAYGREMWKKWFDSNKWSELFSIVVKERLSDYL